MNTRFPATAGRAPDATLRRRCACTPTKVPLWAKGQKRTDAEFCAKVRGGKRGIMLPGSPSAFCARRTARTARRRAHTLHADTHLLRAERSRGPVVAGSWGRKRNGKGRTHRPQLGPARKLNRPSKTLKSEPLPSRSRSSRKNCASDQKTRGVTVVPLLALNTAIPGDLEFNARE
jgi:hypothetical protein